MSDDEREEDNGIVSYRVQVPAWRNSALAPFLRAFDNISAMCKEKDGIPDRRGNPVHIRVSGGADALKNAVRGLPANAYAEQWKTTLSEHEVLWLAEAPDYDFKHDRALTR
jgi:hypothetical protein